MPDNDKIYVEAAAGDVITAEAWNEMQELIHDDIRETSTEAAEAIERVDRAGDAEKLDGRDPDQLTEDVLRRVLDEIRARRGYLKAFRILEVGKTEVIEHGFGDCPVVDVYQLDYFRVVCSEDDEVSPQWATFFLYHSDETRLRYPKGEGYPKGQVEIEPREGPVYKIPFHLLLDKYRVEYDGKTSLGDLETEFWRAFFADPSERFDDDQYCHSPWFDRCCRQEKTVRQLKDSGDWDEILFQARPRKTINYPAPVPQQRDDDGDGGLNFGWSFLDLTLDADASPVTPAPTQLQVCQYDLDRVGLTLLSDPVYPKEKVSSGTGPNGQRLPGSLEDQFGERVLHELKVMVILKC